MKRRELLNPGYKTFTGKILDQYDCNYYNSTQDRINSWIDAGMDPPEELLNASHYVFCFISGCFTKEMNK